VCRRSILLEHEVVVRDTANCRYNLVRVRWGSVAADGYRHKISNNNQLKQVLIDFWAQLSQDTLNQAIDQLPKRLVTKAKGGHVEFRLN